MGIRRLAGSVLAVMRDESPHIFGDMLRASNADGNDIIETTHSKV